MKIIKTFFVFERNIKLKCYILGSNNHILIASTPHGNLGSKDIGFRLTATEYNPPEKEDPSPGLCGTNN
jgi:hypothetical protein